MDGTFRVGTFRPWAGYALPNGLWRTLDWHVLGRSRDTVGEAHQPHFLQHVAIIVDARLIYANPDDEPALQEGHAAAQSRFAVDKFELQL